MIVLEARERVGGRAHTIQASPDVVFDVGCGWLHSADENSFVPIAEQLGFEINRDLPPWRERAYGNAFPQGERNAFIRALDEFYDRAEAAAEQWEAGDRWLRVTVDADSVALVRLGGAGAGAAPVREVVPLAVGTSVQRVVSALAAHLGTPVELHPGLDLHLVAGVADLPPLAWTDALLEEPTGKAG